MDAHGADDEIRVEGLDPPIETPRLRGKVIARASMHDLLDELSSDLTAHALASSATSTSRSPAGRRRCRSTSS
jgi:hypothetical protein